MISPLHNFIRNVACSTATAFADIHGFSQWSVRHWTRGDKIPNPEMQDRIERATDGAVTPADWATFGQARRAEPVAATA